MGKVSRHPLFNYRGIELRLGDHFNRIIPANHLHAADANGDLWDDGGSAIAFKSG